MLINSVILVLREVLEAAMVVSVLLALSINLRLSLRWLRTALPITAVFTMLFAFNLDAMTDAFDGAGQEIVSAALQGLVLLSLVFIVLLNEEQFQERMATVLQLPWLMALAVVCALVREGSEILIYIIGFTASEQHRTAVFAGSAVGAGIGVSLGVLLFAALRALPTNLASALCYVLLALIGAGMIMQSSMLLEQVDWLPASEPLWDSSRIISEHSITGQLLYAVFGYEATPGPIQGVLYLSSLGAVAAAWLLPRITLGVASEK